MKIPNDAMTHVCRPPNPPSVGGETAERICDVFRMLAEPSRLKIVLTLLGGELCVYHILESVGGTQSALSHQLRVLKDNRVLRARRDGQNVYYSLADEHVREMVSIGLKHGACGGGV
jgi:ArsR family transcriptional regulator